MANGTLKVQNIETSSGSGTITLGQSGETIALGSGVTSKLNQPAFEAYLSADQGVNDGETTKAEVDVKVFDTDNCFDTSTHRFTPTVAGRYFVYAKVCMSGSADASVRDTQTRIHKNGNSYAVSDWRYDNNDIARGSPNTIAIVNMNGTTDYLEMFGYINITSGSASFKAFIADSAAEQKTTLFGAYRLGVE